jgi:prepilin-type N-terminal cleavage/methylation domain-containing protein
MITPLSSRRHSGFTLVELMTVVAIIGGLTAIALPGFKRYTDVASAKTCVANLKKLQGAKEQWALDTRKDGSAVPLWEELIGSDNYIKVQPQCSSTPDPYVLGKIDDLPGCPSGLETHTLE